MTAAAPCGRGDREDELAGRLGAAFHGVYAIERELGGGVMSRVFAAEETALGRRVAIKVLAPEVSSAMDTERFRREVQVAARLQHPHIVPVLTAGEVEGMLYYTMPFIEGQSLRVRLTHVGPFPIDAAVCVLRDVGRALVCAHRRGVVHRDVKPENVLLHEGGDALVADFGIAKALSASTSVVHTAAGFVLGTPAYVAPEQIAGDPAADHRADLYSLGIVAYELLAGVHPFAGRSPQAVITAHMLETPMPVAQRRSDVPPWLAAVVAQLLEKHPADRAQSAEELLRALDVAGGRGASAASGAQGGGAPGWGHLMLAAAAQAAANLTNAGGTAAGESTPPATGVVPGAWPILGGRVQQFLTHSFHAYTGRWPGRS